MLRCGAAWIVIGAALLPAWAEDQPAPVERQAKVTVESVKGRADRLVITNGRKWAPLKKGDVLEEMTIVRTGFGTKVVLKFEDRGEFTLKGACKIGISQFRRSGAKATARVGMKYGSIRASVAKGRGPSDFKVKTPVATLSVRGSDSEFALLVDNPDPLKINVDTGNWNMVGPSASHTAGPGESTNNSGTQNSQNLVDQRDVQLGDASGGLTPQEQNNLNQNGDGRGTFSNSGSSGGGNPVTTPPVTPSDITNGQGELVFPED